MSSTHSVTLICPTCGQRGRASWAHPENGRAGLRRLIDLTDGFAGVMRRGGREPEVVCVTCEKEYTSAAASSSALAER